MREGDIYRVSTKNFVIEDRMKDRVPVKFLLCSMAIYDFSVALGNYSYNGC